MSNLVIVAIPDENERVWQISSEKVPHLTLLYLGDADQVSNLDKILEFVQHAASTTLQRFYLPVDRRDTLGSDDADVLFFRRASYDMKALREFRASLLKDDNIRTAYDSAAQIDGPWLPHLTLGYPASPAKKDDTDNPQGFYDVKFDKIAVWTDDYDGPEFLLKDYWDEIEAMENAPGDFAMSDTTKSGADVVASILEHHGVRGMKWGVVRRTEAAKTADASTNPPKPRSGIRARVVARADKKFEKKANKPYNFLDVHNEAVKQYNRTDLKKINDKPAYKNADFTKPSALRTRYYREHEEAFAKQLETAANAKKNASGTRSYTVHVNDDGTWHLTTKEIRHADLSTDETDLPLKVTFDANGFITSIDFAETDATSVAQSAVRMIATDGEIFVDALVHHGVRGMKWGQHRAAPSPIAPHAESKVPHGDKRKTRIQVEGGENHPAHEDAIRVAKAKVKLAKSGPSALSNNELRDVATRVQLEQQVRQLVQPAGKKFVNNLLKSQGNQAANLVIGKQVRRKLAIA